MRACDSSTINPTYFTPPSEGEKSTPTQNKTQKRNKNHSQHDVAEVRQGKGETQLKIMNLRPQQL